MRTIPEPSYSLEILPGAVPTPSRIIAHAIWQKRRGALRPHGPDTGDTKALDDEMTSATALKRFHPILDVSVLPEDFRTSATLWNRAVEQLVLRVNDLAKRAEELTCEEMEKEIDGIEREYYREWQRDTLRWVYDKKKMDRWHYNRFGFAWDAATARARLGCALFHKDWKYAAIACQDLALCEGGGPIGPGPPWREWDMNPEWREREFYYLRQWGLPGRTILAYESVRPVLGPLRDTLEHRVLFPIYRPTISVLEGIDRLIGKKAAEPTPTPTVLAPPPTSD